jgi:hypothetical protein
MILSVRKGEDKIRLTALPKPLFCVLPRRSEDWWMLDVPLPATLGVRGCVQVGDDVIGIIEIQKLIPQRRQEHRQNRRPRQAQAGRSPKRLRFTRS